MNRTFAMKAAVPAIIPKPRMPAIIAIRRKVNTKPNILLTSSFWTSPTVVTVSFKKLEVKKAYVLLKRNLITACRFGKD